MLFSHVCEGAGSLEVVPSPKFQVMFSTPSKAGMVIVKGEHAESMSNARSTDAEGNAVTVSVAVSVQPNSCVTVNVTSNAVFSPLAKNSCAAVSVEADSPFPKSQLNALAKFDSLEKLTDKGSHPSTTSEVKSAVGDGFTCKRATAIPPHPYSVSASKVMMEAEALSVLFSQV